MFKGGIDSSSGFTMGMYEHQREDERRRGAAVEVMPGGSGLGNRAFGVPSSWGGFAGCAYTGGGRDDKARFPRLPKEGPPQKGHPQRRARGHARPG